MTKPHIVRDNKGRLINAKTYNQARAVDLKKQNKKEKRK
jgi:hypothetical protein